MEAHTRPLLIVEDDQSIARLVARVAARQGWVVDTVCNASDALDRISENDYSAVILDLMLQSGSGGDVIETLRREKPDWLKRVIVMTASPLLIRHLATDDLAGTLTKPFDIVDLTSLLNEVTR